MLSVGELARPPDQHLRDGQQGAAIEELGERASGNGRSRASERGEERENGLRLGERDVGDLGTEASVPAKGGTLEAWGIRIAKEERELERVSEADMRKLFRGGPGSERVARVEGAPKARVGVPLRRHERTFAQPRASSTPGGLL